MVRRCFAYANLAKTNPATTPRYWNCSFCSARLRRNRFSPRLCKHPSLHVRDTLPFDRLMRNFKRNSSCYERTGRNFDRIELWRSRAEKTKIPTARRRSHTDSVETSRTTNVVCVPLSTSMNHENANGETGYERYPPRSGLICRLLAVEARKMFWRMMRDELW